ncbi:MAG: zinc-dependent alcohol dehydrogenase family protein [Pseudomonadota bacterium]
MKAIELTRFGLDGLVPAERALPEPGHGEVRVKLAAASLNFHDLATVMGMANPRMKLPCIPLSDGAGTIDAVGPGVSARRTGERVSSTFFPRWPAGAPTRARLAYVPGEHLDGCLADCIILPADGVMPVPAHLTDAEAATLPCAALTAWRAVAVEANVQAGQRVLLQGTGGVSLFALQFAKLLGAETIITSSSDEKLARARAMGADHVINYRTTPEWGKRARELAGGEGVDLVVEVGGSGTFNQSLNALKIGGHISMIGVLTGIADVIPTAKIMAMNATVKGITVGSQEDFTAMNRAIAAAKLKPVIGERLRFDQAKDALALMQRGGHFGKIVLDYSL